jgi:hypothetical protein
VEEFARRERQRADRALKTAGRRKLKLTKEFLDNLRIVYPFSAINLFSLEKEIERLQRAFEHALKERWKTLPKDHPAKCPISLFGAMDYGRLEVAHTRTLAWLLDPSKEHGFGRVLLDSFLHSLHIDGKLTETKVTAERLFKSSSNTDVGRTDIWIEGRIRHAQWRIVIEAKIGAKEIIPKEKIFEVDKRTVLRSVASAVRKIRKKQLEDLFEI